MLTSPEKQELLWAVGCYLPVFNVVVCLLASVKMVHSKFCLFHMRQGLVLFAFWFGILFISFLSQTLGLMFWGVLLLLYISGAVIAFSGSDTAIPVVGSLALKIPETYLFRKLTGKLPESDDGHGAGKSDGQINH